MEEIDRCFNEMKISDYEGIPSGSGIFTRYLFIKHNVYWTLLINILGGAKNESLYWAYELYYSGFKKETIMFIMHIFNVFYINTTTISFKNIIAEKINNWLLTEDETIIGTLIYNICNKNADISGFFIKSNYISNTFKKFNIPYQETETGYILLNNNARNSNNIFVNMTQIDITHYKDIDCYCENYKPRYVLGLVTKYKCQESTLDILKYINNYNISTDYIKNLIINYHNKNKCIEIVKNMEKLLVELYYTPIWNNRFKAYCAKLDYKYGQENQIINGIAMKEFKIKFPDNYSYENFCNLYWYEPDENLTSFINSRF